MPPESAATETSASAQSPGQRTKAARRTGGRKTRSRFAELAGDGDPERFMGSDDSLGGGLTAGIASRLRTFDGHAVVDLDVSKVASHPYNDARRSLPQPGNPKWEELLNGVRANGVKVPGLFVTRNAFLARRPTAEDQLGDAEFVVIYGHRRLAAVKAAGRPTMPGVVDDSVMQDDGDLDAMTLENLGREDQSELAEASLFARYSDELGLGQRAIAEKLGVDQATVSRRLALLLLCPEAQDAVERKDLPGAAAAALAGALPYGPRRKWQKSSDPNQNSPERKADQLAALSLITTENMNPTRAAERVIAERTSRARATADGLRLIDPGNEFGKRQAQHRLYSDEAVKTARAADRLVAAIDANQGTLIYYSSEPPAAKPDRSPAVRAADLRKEAAESRRACCLTLAKTPLGRDSLLDVLITQGVLGMEGQSSDVWKLAHEWAKHLDLDVPASADQFRATLPRVADPRIRSHSAWLLALARFEVSTSNSSQWGLAEATYLDLLVSKGGYRATPWEQEQLDRATTG